MAGVGGGEDGGAGGVDLLGLAGVYDVGGEQPEAGVAVMVVVGVEELGAERAGVLDRGEGGGEARAVLQGLELRFAVGVVRLFALEVGVTDSRV